MNIKQHIEAGHYPEDRHGFPEVPREAGTVSILSTNGPRPEYVIVGMRDQRLYGWDAEGKPYLGFVDGTRLLPPPPRKVEIKGWAIVRSKTGAILCMRETAPAGVATGIERLVELTGSYEEPWE